MAQTVKRIPCEVYSRIVGYYRPIKKWNQGKQQEFAERRVYKIESDTAESEESNGKVLGDA